MKEYKRLNRRNFIRQTLLGSGALLASSVLARDVFPSDELIKLTILHTNDLHSHIDPFPEDHPKYAGMGGLARRATFIKNIRKGEKNVLLFDAGDIWQGTSYFDMFYGELELKLMSEMGYDASAIGEHEFANGTDGLAKQMQHAVFPFINCNYDFSDTPMNGKTIPYKIFNKEDLKIGVFGIGINPDGLIDRQKFGNTKYLDPVIKSAETAHLLKKEMSCDMVICLSHLGDHYDDNRLSDLVLAKQSKNIDLIIGGHTHRFMDQPMVLINSDKKEILIAQAGWAGIGLGKINFYLSRDKKRKFSFGSTVKISYK